MTLPDTHLSLDISAPPISHGVPWPDADRLQAFNQWLGQLSASHGVLTNSLRAASADASFRRYLRADTAQGHSLIIMDAPPQHENCQPFVAIAQLLCGAGVRAPDILAWDEPHGFMLLSDLGESTLLSTLVPSATAFSPEDRDNQTRYWAALNELVKLQGIKAQPSVPQYDHALLQRELDLLPDWYLTQLHGLVLSDTQKQMLSQVFDKITSQVLGQPCVLVHRDFHSRNLMSDPSNPGAKPGVIDFQDAVWGPITYDVVSLLRDAYVLWDEEKQIDLAVRYWESARQAALPVREDFGDFWLDFEWMGLQRHLKVLGIFARLALRDNKKQYLADIPRVWHYAHKVCTRYQGLGPLAILLEEAQPDTLGVTRQTGYTF